jgi:hypothetical protein
MKEFVLTAYRQGSSLPILRLMVPDALSLSWDDALLELVLGLIKVLEFPTDCKYYLEPISDYSSIDYSLLPVFKFTGEV